MSKLTTIPIAALAALVVSGTPALAANQTMSPPRAHDHGQAAR
jgi:hypothetical protein